MSWSLSGAVPEGENPNKVILDAAPSLTPGYAETEQLDAVGAAKRALADLIKTVGGPPVRFSASGHANEDHDPSGNWTQDFITVNVYRRPKEEVASGDE